MERGKRDIIKSENVKDSFSKRKKINNHSSEMSSKASLVPVIQSVFSRWTALQLAVSQSMGGAESEPKYEAFIETFAEFLIRNTRSMSSISVLESEIQEFLDDVLDDEFNTLLDDGSSSELAHVFVRYVQLIQQGKLADVQQELHLQQPTSSLQMSVRNTNEDESSSSESEDEMADEKPTTTTESRSQAMDVDEDGWVTVQRRSGGKK